MLTTIERCYALRAPATLRVRRQIDFVTWLLNELSIGPELVDEEYLGNSDPFRQRVALQEFGLLERHVREFANLLSITADRLRFELATVRQELSRDRADHP